MKLFRKENLKLLALIIIAAFFTALFLYINGPKVTDTLGTKNKQNAFFKGNQGVALTFNITGGGTENAKTILEILEKEDIRSVTFFISGAWAQQHPDFIKKITARNHEIALLGYDYIDYSDAKKEDIKEDIQKAQIAFKKLNLPEINLVRAPTGAFNQTTLQATNELGLTLVHWTINTHDWKKPGVEEITKAANQAKKGDIILLTASDSSIETTKALPAIIKEMKTKELEPVTISEMLANGKSKTKEL